ncbi:succinate dehydrogenase catalytic subunit [Candidatus Vecturithrix granuli]|uniref:Succinate dehydrogenase catalytic subunit n=1 Tax=Vecturithrix granuli TaxID=1499967 RepID=A0A081C2H5_VECG1|nr:succinate dehydrogenase catalytic subunit [Candidatus Vecturithrix granuli]
MYRILDVLKFIVVFVLMGMIVYLVYLFYLTWTHPEVDIYLFNTSPYTFETFLKSLEERHIPPVDEHERLYKVLQRLDKSYLGNLRTHTEIPYDYRFFFRQVVPEFLQSGEQTPASPEQRGTILATFTRKSDYVAKLLRISGPDALILKGVRKVKGYTKRLEMTATYTSEFQYPTGLFVVDGQVLNPVLQAWDGLAILDSSGKFHIRNIENLEYQFRRYAIKHVHQDYLDFLKLAERQRFSIFQSHLLISNGNIDKSLDNTEPDRRRVIFQDVSETVSIYDSFNQKLTLYEAADILKEQYAAMYAMNLDTGPYGYCGRYDNDQRVVLYGGKGQNVELTNVLVFNYK